MAQQLVQLQLGEQPELELQVQRLEELVQLVEQQVQAQQLVQQHR
jgi:hypothetical protein